MRDVRTLPLAACKDVWVPGGRRAAEAGLVQVGTGATEGTQSQGKASRHQALRDG
jgi:hypothetical protein